MYERKILKIFCIGASQVGSSWDFKSGAENFEH